jgi:hypothetical protein
MNSSVRTSVLVACISPPLLSASRIGSPPSAQPTSDEAGLRRLGQFCNWKDFE